MSKGSDLLVSALANEGVDRIFGVPGEENLDVVESLRKSKIKLILTRHEQAAAFMAARAASISRTGGEAQGAADAAAAAQLAQDGVSCANRSVSVDTSGFGIEPGQTALVAVSVTCRAELGDLPVPGMPSTKAFTGQYTSVIDTYRGRS